MGFTAVVLIGAVLALTMGRDSGKGAEADDRDSSPADLPPYQDPTAPASEVVEALNGKFCSGSGDVTDVESSGYVRLDCITNDIADAYHFYVFSSEQELNLYLANQTCESGRFYEGGTTWFADVPVVANAAALENEAGTTPLNCG